MNMYIMVDAELGTTGIRDEFNGELEYADLKLSKEFILKLKSWLSDYEDFNYKADSYSEYDKTEVINKLDTKGVELAKELKTFISKEIKVSYYSDALQKKTII